MKPTGNLVADTICRTAEIGLAITGAADAGALTIIEATPVAVIGVCPDCGQPGKLRDHVTRRLVDLPVVGFPTRLHVTVPRFLCTAVSCKRKIFQESLTCADDGAKLTYRVTRWILQRLAIDRMSVSATAKALGVGWDLVNQVALDACRQLVYGDPGHLDGVRVLGVDEHVWKHTRKPGQASNRKGHFILMDMPQKEQTEVYEKYWNEMEKNVDFNTDEFIRWFLVSQTSKTPSKADIFEAFKLFSKRSSKTNHQIAQDLHQFSLYSKALTEADTGDKNVDKRLRRANLMLSGVVQPLLWLTYRDLKKGVIDAKDFENLLEVIESYLFRRVVSNLAANSLTKTFSGAYNDIRKLRKNDESYSEILAYVLMSRRGGARFPDDSEFKEAFQTKDFYAMKNYRGYFFDFLERGFSKDVVDIAGYIAVNELTIEHTSCRRR